MAVYTCITQEGTLSAEQRADLAKEITRSHVAISGKPASFVWVIFETVSPDSTFSGGKPAVNASIVGIIRGRSTEVKAQLLNDLWSLYKNVTGLSDDQLWVSVTEIPPSNAMEFGALLASTRPRSRMAGFARPDQAIRGIATQGVITRRGALELRRKQWNVARFLAPSRAHLSVSRWRALPLNAREHSIQQHLAHV